MDDGDVNNIVVVSSGCCGDVTGSLINLHKLHSGPPVPVHVDPGSPATNMKHNYTRDTCSPDALNTRFLVSFNLQITSSPPPPPPPNNPHRV